MRVAILGGDGYLGWATAMHLSRHGHHVAVVDNYLRRKLNLSWDSLPLFPVPTLPERARAWESVSDRTIEVAVGDVCDWAFTRAFFAEFRPDAVIHYAELPSAPFSMADRDSAALTLNNNLTSTLNIIYAVREIVPDAHIVKLGTMGEYGTPNIDIEEGWIDIEHKGRHDRFLFPRQGGSLYHTTKVMDTDMLWFYARTWGLRVTDLMQGPVYGVGTDESGLDAALMPHFSYDAVFGTVINRFAVQVAAGIPLTIYGKGSQQRGFIDIRDTVQCLRLVVETPPAAGELRIFNQFVEVFSVAELAERFVAVGRRMGYNPTAQHLDNPRTEAEEHYYNPAHSRLGDLGLSPHRLTDDTLAGMIDLVAAHHSSIDRRHLLPGVRWR